MDVSYWRTQVLRFWRRLWVWWEVEYHAGRKLHVFHLGRRSWALPRPEVSVALWAFDFRRTHERFLDELGSGDVVVDVGVASGEYTVPAARRVGPGGKVVGVEADAHSRAAALWNIDERDLGDRVEVVSAVLDDRPRTVDFHRHSHLANHRLSPMPASPMDPAEPSEYMGLACDTRTLDSVLEYDGEVDLLKVTVNGAEAAVLRGGRGVLDRTRQVVLNTDYPEASYVLENHGFQLVEERSHERLGGPQLWRREA